MFNHFMTYTNISIMCILKKTATFLQKVKQWSKKKKSTILRQTDAQGKIIEHGSFETEHFFFV